MRERMKEEALLAVFFSLSHAHAPKDERTSGERLLSPLLLFFDDDDDDDIYSEDVLKVQKGRDSLSRVFRVLNPKFKVVVILEVLERRSYSFKGTHTLCATETDRERENGKF